jgi:ubiquitin-protein ligase
MRFSVFHRYPFAPPDGFRFATKLWHPRVGAAAAGGGGGGGGTGGEICLGLSTQGSAGSPPTWAAAMTLANLPPLLLSILANPDGEANSEAMHQLEQNKPAFVAKAKEWTKNFAK